MPNTNSECCSKCLLVRLSMTKSIRTFIFYLLCPQNTDVVAQLICYLSKNKQQYTNSHVHAQTLTQRSFWVTRGLKHMHVGKSATSTQKGAGQVSNRQWGNSTNHTCGSCVSKIEWEAEPSAIRFLSCGTSS